MLFMLRVTRHYVFSQGKPEVAIPTCHKAIQELEKETGRNNPDLASLHAQHPGNHLSRTGSL